jgi:PAS domain S-box-containing protein
METTTEIRRLQSCINDLISVLALPAIWSGSESSQILGTLLDVLSTMLRLDFAYARLSAVSDDSPIEVVRLGDHRHSSIQPRQFGQALDCWLTGDQAVWRSAIPVVAGEAELSIASFPLGLQRDGGVLVAGSRRADFPTEVERLLLRVAANQAGIGLQEARRSGEQKRIAVMLEQRVAERTGRLTAVNDELRHSEAYLAEAQRLSRTGSFGWKVSTGDIVWSEETFRIFQYERTTKPTLELILQRVHSEDAAGVQQTIERASRKGKNFDHEYRLVMPDGSVKHVNVVARAERDELDELEFVGAVMDITERRRAEEALRQSESYLAEAQRLTHTGSWVWSVPGRDSLHLSEEWYRIYGFDPKKGVPAWEERLRRIHPEDRARRKMAIGRAVGEKADFEVEYRVLLPDGTVKYIHTIGHPVLNASGELVQFVGSTMDISDRKRAEMLLAGEKRLLEMIARRDSRAAILDALCRLVEELASGSLSSVLMLDPSTNCLRHGAAPSLPSSYADAIDGSEIGPSAGSCGTAAYRGERVIVSNIATDPLWADFRDLALAHGLRACWSTPILSSEGKVLGTFAIYYREPRNPTPQEHHVIERITHLASIAIGGEQAEEALRQAQADLARVSRVTTMGELTASLSHEVNQPIAAAVTDANTCVRWLARDHPDLEEAREAASRVVKDASRAADIIARIRSQFKKGAPERELVDVNEVVREILVLLQSETARYSISVRTELAGDLPQVTGDHVQLQQVMLNLIMNSIDAMKAVEETRELAIQSQRTQNEQLQVCVTDTGVGLPPRQTEQIFNAFFTTKADGTGMGLRISRSIVESHGGRLWAAPNSPRGASFYLTLPMKDEAHE